jgi:dnd system-associated protein 4
MSSQTRQTYKQSKIYHKLVDDHDIFDNYIDCFVFAASVGYREGRYEPDDYDGDGEMLWMHFGSHDLYRAAAAAIAYQHTDDPASLTDPGKQLEVLAKFAAGGAEILEDEFGDTKGTPREGLLNYIQAQTSDSEDEGDNEMLERIARSFDEELLSG